jgi:hypothetical protein
MVTTDKHTKVVESVEHGVGLTDDQAEEIRAELEVVDEKIAVFRGEMATVQLRMKENTKPQAEEIIALKARIVALQADAQAKTAGDETTFKELSQKVGDLLSETNAKRQRINAYAVARIEALKAEQNKYTKLLPSVQKKQMVSTATPSDGPEVVSGRRHNKGCKDGTLRLAGGVCKLCQELNVW